MNVTIRTEIQNSCYEMMKVYTVIRYSRYARELAVKLEAKGISWKGRAGSDLVKLDVKGPERRERN